MDTIDSFSLYSAIFVPYLLGVQKLHANILFKLTLFCRLRTLVNRLDPGFMDKPIIYCAISVQYEKTVGFKFIGQTLRASK